MNAFAEQGRDKNQYRSCNLISSFFINFSGRIDTGGKCVTICCAESIEDIPGIELRDTGKETIEDFIMLRKNVISEGMAAAASPMYAKGCAKCVNYQLGNWVNDSLIYYVNLSMYPSPCQCSCVYCGVYRDDGAAFGKKEVIEGYDKLFSAIEYAKEKKLIAPTAKWQVSCGEITIHPYKDRIFSYLKDQSCVFFTNCFIFDERIGKNLAQNPKSAINLSIDSGTAETWRKVKGFDNLGEVSENLVRYYECCSKPGQISLKYIILPDINATYEDYVSVVEIMKVLGCKHLTLSHDTNTKYSMTKEMKDTLIGSAGYLIAVLHKNYMTFDMFTFSPDDRDSAVAFAVELLKAGEV